MGDGRAAAYRELDSLHAAEVVVHARDAVGPALGAKVDVDLLAGLADLTRERPDVRELRRARARLLALLLVRALNVGGGEALATAVGALLGAHNLDAAEAARVVGCTGDESRKRERATGAEEGRRAEESVGMAEGSKHILGSHGSAGSPDRVVSSSSIPSSYSPVKGLLMPVRADTARAGRAGSAAAAREADSRPRRETTASGVGRLNESEARPRESMCFCDIGGGLRPRKRKMHAKDRRATRSRARGAGHNECHPPSCTRGGVLRSLCTICRCLRRRHTTAEPPPALPGVT